MMMIVWGSSTNSVWTHTGPLLQLVQGTELGFNGVKYASMQTVMLSYKIYNKFPYRITCHIEQHILQNNLIYRTTCPTEQTVLQNKQSYRTTCPTEQPVLHTGYQVGHVFTYLSMYIDLCQKLGT